MTNDEIKRWRTCAPLLPDGGCEAVNTLLDEIERLRGRHMSGRELNAVRRAIDIARDADLLEWDTHDQRVLAIAALDRLFADGSVG